MLLSIRAHNLKTCIYSGFDIVAPFVAFLPMLDYLKLGHYDERLGGLDSPTTNQRFFRIEAGKLFDQTYLFRRREIELHDHG